MCLHMEGDAQNDVQKSCSIPAYKRWCNHVLGHKINSNEDIDETVRSIKETIEREQNPPKIDLKDGWSPYAIKDCLEECGLRSDTYDLFFLEEWRAKAHFKFEGIGVLRNTIDFSVNGTKEMATQLVLKFSCWDPENLKADYEDFIFDCHILFTCAFGTSMPKALDEKLQCRSNFQDEHQGKDIKVVFDDFPDSPFKGSFEIMFGIENKDTQNPIF